VKRILLVELVFLFLSSNVFALTISTSAKGSITTYYPSRDYETTDNRNANTGTISSYVDLNSTLAMVGDICPVPAYPTYEINAENNNASALSTSNGFLSVSAQCDRSSGIDKFRFSSEASWEDTIINNDSYAKNYIFTTVPTLIE